MCRACPHPWLTRPAVEGPRTLPGKEGGWKDEFPNEIPYKCDTSQKGVTLSFVAREVAGAIEVWGFCVLREPTSGLCGRCPGYVCILRPALRTIPGRPIVSGQPLLSRSPSP